MEHDQIIKELSKVGPAPGADVQWSLPYHPLYQRALDGDRQALKDLKWEWMGITRPEPKVKEIAAGLGPPKGRKRQAEIKSETRPGNSPTAARRRAEIRSKGFAAMEAASDGGVGWRAVCSGSTFNLGRSGKDDRGSWREVHIRLAGNVPFPTATLRLRREPVGLELQPPNSGGAVLERLHWHARRLGLKYGWSEFDAMRWLVTGDVPRPDPLVVRTLTPQDEMGVPIAGAKSVAIMAAADMSPNEVAEAFKKAAGYTRRKRKPRPSRVSPVSLEVVVLVARLTAENGGRRPPWPVIRVEWKKAHPKSKLTPGNLSTIYARHGVT